MAVETTGNHDTSDKPFILPKPPLSFAAIVAGNYGKEAPVSPRAASKSFSSILENVGSTRLKTPGLFKGEPALFFSKEEVEKLSSPFRYTLIGKFPFWRPSMYIIRKFFSSLGLKSLKSVGLIHEKHVVIFISDQEDYSRLLFRSTWYVNGVPLKLSKWSPDFLPHYESPVVPVWIGFPGLPLHFFEKSVLFSLASVFGFPLKTDEPTALLTRPSVARVCIDLDVSKPRDNRVWLGDEKCGFWQEVVFENPPLFCDFCQKLGHEESACFLKNPELKKENNPPSGFLEKKKILSVEKGGVFENLTWKQKTISSNPKINSEAVKVVKDVSLKKDEEGWIIQKSKRNKKNRKEVDSIETLVPKENLALDNSASGLGLSASGLVFLNNGKAKVNSSVIGCPRIALTPFNQKKIPAIPVGAVRKEGGNSVSNPALFVSSQVLMSSQTPTSVKNLSIVECHSKTNNTSIVNDVLTLDSASRVAAFNEERELDKERIIIKGLEDSGTLISICDNKIPSPVERVVQSQSINLIRSGSNLENGKERFASVSHSKISSLDNNGSLDFIEPSFLTITNANGPLTTTGEIKNKSLFGEDLQLQSQFILVGGSHKPSLLTSPQALHSNCEKAIHSRVDFCETKTKPPSLTTSLESGPIGSFGPISLNGPISLVENDNSQVGQTSKQVFNFPPNLFLGGPETSINEGSHSSGPILVDNFVGPNSTLCINELGQVQSTPAGENLSHSTREREVTFDLNFIQSSLFSFLTSYGFKVQPPAHKTIVEFFSLLGPSIEESWTGEVSWFFIQKYFFQFLNGSGVKFPKKLRKLLHLFFLEAENENKPLKENLGPCILNIECTIPSVDDACSDSGDSWETTSVSSAF